MAYKIIKFDNEYTYYINGSYVCDDDDNIIVSLSELFGTLSLDPSKMTETQIWALCKQIINDYKYGMKRQESKFKKQLLQLFNLEN